MTALPGPWAQHAACRGLTDRMTMPDSKCPGRGGWHSHPRVAAALTICHRCPVLAECRTWALQDPDPVPAMIAGGCTPAERDALRGRPRRRTAPLRAALRQEAV